MRKISVLLLGIILVLSNNVLYAQAEEALDPITINVNIEFEEPVTNSYAEIPDSLMLKISWQDDYLMWNSDVVELKKENDFKHTFKDLEKFSLYTRYDISIIENDLSDDYFYYEKDNYMFREEESAEITFKHKLKRTSLNLDLIEGDGKHSYEQSCIWEPAIIEPEDDFDYYMMPMRFREVSNSKAVFQLLELNGKVLKTFETDEEGYAFVDDIPYGQYILRQLSAPEGMLISEDDLILDLKMDSVREQESCEGYITWYNRENSTPDIPETPTPEDPKEEIPKEPLKPVPEDPVPSIPESPKPSLPKDKDLTNEQPRVEVSTPDTSVSNRYVTSVLLVMASLFILLKNSANNDKQ